MNMPLYFNVAWMNGGCLFCSPAPRNPTANLRQSVPAASQQIRKRAISKTGETTDIR
jgi:hypothetical protein